MNILLQGIVGSTAYGLNRPGSDLDYLGVFVHDELEYLKLTNPEESVVTKNPDSALHEARKFCNLLLKCNPTITELLWLDDYVIMDSFGRILRNLREGALSEPYVRNSYLGYAKSQLNRLHDRDTVRASKHAMHMARLVNQGRQLYTQGSLTVKVDDPDWYFHFASQDPDYWTDWYSKQEEEFKSAKCVLPEYPVRASFEGWYQMVRLDFPWPN